MKELTKEKQYVNMVIKEFKADVETRTFKSILTNQTVDRAGEVVKASGVNLKQFREIGVILFNHNKDYILGSPTNTRRVGNDIIMDGKFADEGTGEDIDKIYKLVEQGHLKTMSIGFQYLEHPRQPTAQDRKEFGKDVRLVAGKTLLLEASIVSVPCNQNAMILSCKDLDLDPKAILGDDYCEEVATTPEETPNEETIKAIEDRDLHEVDHIDELFEEVNKEVVEEEIKAITLEVEKQLIQDEITKKVKAQLLQEAELKEAIKAEILKKELYKRGIIVW